MISLLLAATLATASPSVPPTAASAPTSSAPASAPAPSVSPSASGQGHGCAAYWWYGTRKTLCDRFPDADSANCAQIGYRVKVIVAGKGSDPWGLDGSGGGSVGTPGIGCESKPVRRFPSASPSLSVEPSHTSAAPVVISGNSLPTTGPDGWVLGGIGATALLAGGGALLAARRRRHSFQA